MIEREILEEEKRLNDMMEDERRWAVKEELRKEQEDVAKRLRFVKFLKEQIGENEEQRLLELARKKEESRLVDLNNIAWQQDEIEKQRKKEAKSIRLRQEFKEEYEQKKHYKAMEQEENKLIDLRYLLSFSRLFQTHAELLFDPRSVLSRLYQVAQFALETKRMHST